MSNPLISEGLFNKVGVDSNNSMTIDGTVNKSLFLIILTIISALLVWNYAAYIIPFMYPLIIVGLVLGFVIIFFKKTSPYLSPVYAILEGAIIGVVSMFYELQLPGIVLQAVSLTFAVFLGMLLLYKSGLIKISEKFKTGVILATGAIAVVYLISFFGNITGWYSVGYIHDNGIIGIGISLFIVGIASLNLLLDFDNIEKGELVKLPKYMEWYLSFGLLVTLIWLYLEILKLLSKIRSRD